MSFAHELVTSAAALGAVALFALPARADTERLNLAQVDQPTQLQLQSMQNSIRYLQLQMQQITQIKEALAQAQQQDKEQAALLEQRLGKIDNALSGSRLLELVSQVETLNADLNRMRGEVELLRNRIEKVEKRDPSASSDLSERVKKLEQEAAVRGANASPAAVGPETNSSSAAEAVAASAASAASEAPADSIGGAAASGGSAVAEASGAPASADGGIAPAESNSSAAAVSPGSAPTATVAAAVSNPQPAQRDPVAENKLYDEALRQFRGGNYQGAIASFQTFSDKFPSSALAPNAQYWIGVSYFNQRDFSKALQTNQALIKTYPDSAKIPDAMLNMASVHVEQSDYAAARGMLEEVIAKFPVSDAAAKARARLTLLKK